MRRRMVRVDECLDVSLFRDLIPSEYWAGNQTMDADTAAAYEQFVSESRARLNGTSQSTSRRYGGGWSCQQ